MVNQNLLNKLNLDVNSEEFKALSVTEQSFIRFYRKLNGTRKAPVEPVAAKPAKVEAVKKAEEVKPEVHRQKE